MAEELKQIVSSICHGDQLHIWSNDIISAFYMAGYLVDDEHLDMADLHSIADQEITSIVASAIAHPERNLQAENERLREALKAHDKYMADQFSGPDSDAIHPKAAANWKSARAALSGEASK
jgi:hypothetical protein